MSLLLLIPKCFPDLATAYDISVWRFINWYFRLAYFLAFPQRVQQQMMSEENFPRKNWPLQCKLKSHKTICSGSNLESKGSVLKQKGHKDK